MMKCYQWFLKVVFVTMLVVVLLPLNTVGVAAAEEDTPVIHGLKGEYYTNKGGPHWNFDTWKATVIDPQIYFPNFERILEYLTGQDDYVSVRWTGQITPEFTEQYTFSMIGDNGFKLWVDNELIIDFWKNEWDKEQVSKPISLEAGKAYDIKIEYFEDMGGSNLYLRWSSPSVPKQVIPQEAFTVPADYTYHGPIAGYVSVDGLSAEITFTDELLTGAALKDELVINAQGMDWPITAVKTKDNDPKSLVLTFDYAVYSKDTPFVNVTHHGSEALKNAQTGEPYGEFYFVMQNKSEFKLRTPWADKLDENDPLPEYPRPQMVRDEWMNLNGKWEFQVAEAGETLPTGTTLEETILVPFPVESQLSGIERNEKLMWYKRSFNIPEAWDGQRVQLHFGAVDYIATVFVNGEEVGKHKGGYTSFSFDITDQLQTGDNELIVHVFDQTDDGGEQIVGKQTIVNPGGIWYTPVSGIWQTVWLEPVPDSSIERMDMVPKIWDDRLELQVDVINGSNKTIEAIAYDEDGIEVGRVSGAVDETIIVPVPDARWWTPDDPYLYDLKVILKEGSKIIDEVDSYFGMREITLGKVDGVNRPLLNGEFVFQMGPLDQGYWPDGIYTAPTDDALRFDIEAAKRLDMNMIRKHIKVEPARWYYWADKLGMLVWQDMPNGRNNSAEAKAQFYREFDEMVAQLQNSPAIVIWVVFNEAWGQFDEGGPQTREAIAHALAADPTRLINGVTGWFDAGGANNEYDQYASHFLDWHRYPGPDSPKPTTHRAATLGEYGGLGLHVPGHEYSPLVFSYQLMKDKEQLTNQYIQYINAIKTMKENPGLSAAVYTQITDVEYEINGLLSYDRKVEKIDFARVAAAHRELIGKVDKTDLLRVITEAEHVLNQLVVGNQPGQYPQSALDTLQAIVEEAQAVYDQTSATVSELKEKITLLEQALQQLIMQVVDPIAANAFVDQFDSAELASEWNIIRERSKEWSLTETSGALTIHATTGELHERTNNLANVFVRKVDSDDFEITTKVTAEILRNHQQAGLLVYDNDDNYVKLGHVWDTNGGTGKSLETAYELNGTYLKATNLAAHPGNDTIHLKIKKQGNTYSTYYWDGTKWQAAADPITAKLTDPKVGIYAVPAIGDAVPTKAVFHYFTINEGDNGNGGETPERSYDLNGDGRESVADLAVIAARYGLTSNDPNWESAKAADLNGDNVIDEQDIAMMMERLFANARTSQK